MACVWFPGWPLERADAPSGECCLIVGEAVVVAASPEAEAAGVRRGMSRREAEGRCPGALVLERDLAEEARRFDPVVEALEGLVPQVEVVEPGLAFVRMAGAVRYYGGERSLVERLVEEVDGAAGAGRCRIGVADGPFAARWAAVGAVPGAPLVVSDTREFLAGLDVSVLGYDDLVSVFRWLGVVTLGELAGLPREAVASRFGVIGLQAHRLASGEDREVVPRRIPGEWAVEETFEDPLQLLDQVAFAARRLVAGLVTALRREGVACHRVLIEATAGDGGVRTRVWRSPDPFDEQALADRVWWQLRAWVESGGARGGIVRLRLDPFDLSGEGRQLTLLEDTSAWVEAERALARAQALLGPDAVLQATPQGGRMPGERVAWRRWGEEARPPERDPAAPWPGATPPPCPALVPPDPTPFQVEWDGGMPVRVRLGSRWESVLTWSGPWRVVGRWWKEEPPFDRYQLVTSAGAFLVAVSGEGAYLAGVYD